MYRQYPTKFENQVNLMADRLKKCGANIDGLSERLQNLRQATWRNITYLEGIAFELRNAAYDIPGGQPECGTKAKISGGFSEKDTGDYILKTGRSALGVSEDQLEKGPFSPMTIFGMDIFKVYLLDGHFYVDTTIYGGFPWPSIKIVRNEFAIGNPSLDRNFTENAFEVVDASGVPLLQMIFESDRQVRINGVFPSKDGKSVVIITPAGTSKEDIDLTGKTRVTVPLKRLFKYPSWKYRGVYADN